MNQKKIIFAFVAAILFWGGFMLYRQHKLAYEQEAQSIKEYERLLDAARRSPIAGLTHMGRALKEYYKVNNVYPPKLIDLYPKYIPIQSFIDELDWEYEPMDKDFYLSKYITMGNKPMVAYVTSDLEPGVDAEATESSTRDRRERARLAAAKSKKRRLKTVRGKLAEEKPPGEKEEPLEEDEEEEEEEEEEFASLDDITSQPLSEDFKAYPTPGAAKPDASGQWVMTEGGKGFVFKPEDSREARPVDSAKDVSTSISKISEKFLVWKYKDGVHGFGNIQYPETQRITIAVQGKWRYLNWPRTDAESLGDPNARPDEKENAGADSPTSRPPDASNSGKADAPTAVSPGKVLGKK